jgi:hypothetical protein
MHIIFQHLPWNALPVKTETATDGEGTEDAESSLNLNPSTFSIMIAKAQKAHTETPDMNENSIDVPGTMKMSYT